MPLYNPKLFFLFSDLVGICEEIVGPSTEFLDSIYVKTYREPKNNELIQVIFISHYNYEPIELCIHDFSPCAVAHTSSTAQCAVELCIQDLQ